MSLHDECLALSQEFHRVKNYRGTGWPNLRFKIKIMSISMLFFPRGFPTSTGAQHEQRPHIAKKIKGEKDQALFISIQNEHFHYLVLRSATDDTQYF